jgi:hypothetical protein
MKSFKEIAEEYQKEINIEEGAKLKKMKKWVPDEKGNLKKVLKKACVDTQGVRMPGYKIVGKKCEKMSPVEIKDKKKTMKKVMKTKKKHANINAKRAEVIARKRKSKGLI